MMRSFAYSSAQSMFLTIIRFRTISKHRVRDRAWPKTIHHNPTRVPDDARRDGTRANA